MRNLASNAVLKTVLEACPCREAMQYIEFSRKMAFGGVYIAGSPAGQGGMSS